MPRCPDLPCADCGKLMWRGTTSLPEGMARCNPCRKANPQQPKLDLAKCGTPRGRDQHRRRNEPCCEPCRVAWNEVSAERSKRALAQGWVRPDREPPKVKFRAGDCSRCGKKLTRAALDEPLCAPCRGNRPGYNIAVSPTARLAIYERDQWICQICTEPVDPLAPKNSTWDATLDHIVPRSQGGTDVPENLRLAHRWCNSVRGDLSHHTDEDLRVA